ncbi:PspC domain-containing protein [Actinoplanes sp. CA-252034]|uniref:PspC domain-containing protein n=1 Tax=Actinoplanes sp. CA-252034 TaxID=3239906 RepID=UPI003D9970F3
MNDEPSGAGPKKGDQAPSDQPGGFPPGSNVPPWVSTASAVWARQQLVRPRQGRYVAGVCGAVARATNTDPVLWRVLLAVLAVLGGSGVLLYLIGWLIMPSEGDTASPVESLLGKGRSGMQPLSVVLLGGAALITFAFIVNDGVRAGMLAAAVILGAFLLIKRSGAPSFPATAPPGAPPTAPPPHAEEPTVAFVAAPTASPADESMTTPPAYTPPPPPPTGGFRPPFAPHGPFAGPTPPPPAPPAPPKPPKPPKERSILGRLTFFAVIMVSGLIGALDMSGVDVDISAYFAAALATTALGLIVGAWFGRARGLIALAVVLSFALGVSSGLERFGREWTPSVYRPATLAEVADTYEFNAGNVTLDLRQIDFTGQTQNTAIDMKLGQLKVLLPAKVDATVEAGVEGGRLVLFTEEFADSSYRQTTDLGSDGAGGGTLNLDIRLEAGNVEVIR